MTFHHETVAGPPTGGAAPAAPAGPRPDELLRCAPGLRVEIYSATRIGLFTAGRASDGGPHALAVIGAFVHPRTVRDAMEHLRPLVTGVQDWIELSSTVVRLFRQGVLRRAGNDRASIAASPSSFDAAPVQAVMLNDRTRTGRFLEAVRNVVRPGDVVIDLGTGTGILAIAAARAGAAKVYAIEAGSIASCAREMFVANGVADRVELLEGWSTEVTLPERADVLVSEIIGNHPFGEGVLEFTRDALARFLRPGARLVPARLELFALPVTVPDDEVGKRTFSPAAVAAWQGWYGIDFAPLARAALTSPHFFLAVSKKARDWPRLGEPTPLLELDLARFDHWPVDVCRQVGIERPGHLSGILVYFEAELAPGLRLSTHPDRADPDNSWASPVWLFPPGAAVQPGDHIDLRFRHGVAGSRDGVELTIPGLPRDPETARLP